MANTFKCDFADGPLQGQLDMALPIEDLPPRMRFAITKEGTLCDDAGVPGGFVEYEKRREQGAWSFHHVATDVSSEAARVFCEQLSAGAVALRQLSPYSTAQIIHELLGRQTFAGVLVYVAGDVTTGEVSAGSRIEVAVSRYFTAPKNAAVLLRSGLGALEQSGESAAGGEQGGDGRRFTFEVDGIKTLPLYAIGGKTKGELTPFGKCEVDVSYVDPEYEPPEYHLGSAGERIGRDPDAAIEAVNAWRKHLSDFLYFAQFKDDKSRRLVRAFYDHTELVATLCDSRLRINPTGLWEAFDAVIGLEAIQSDYRADPLRESKYTDYSRKLDKAIERWSVHMSPAVRLLHRITMQIGLKRSHWNDLDPIVAATPATEPAGKTPAPEATPAQGARPGSAANSPIASSLPLQLFYSYSHEDEQFRVDLEKHLALLKRNGIIEGWHFRRIPPGREWEGEIDQHLESAHIILLLISADFLFSNYCWEIEGRKAMDRHNQRLATVIPVVLRACDWANSIFGTLQALPADAKPIASWSDRDEALTDVAKGIRRVADTIRSARDMT